MTRNARRSRLNRRQTEILARVESLGFVTIESMAEEFDVSAQTVRRDIILLSDAGLLQRFHGGAGIGSGGIGATETVRLDHEHKRGVAIDEKQRVAEMAADLLPEGASLFVDVGTTCEITAIALNRRPGFRIFTNSMRVALAFDPAAHDVNVLGRKVEGRDGSLVGEEIMLSLAALRVDCALIGCSAVDVDGRVMDFDLSKIAVKKAAMNAATRKFLIATPSKFGRTALSAFADVSDFDAVIDGTDVPRAPYSPSKA
ncbi:DeoR/GlpR family DNA-binding transcription regulator [Tropicimonas sp. IMCC34011]|uniref:DeoR/GlpR family DNA-binding transcription regulator n=1 Tax=Tropicimonas sp. IMCC34011 TaxID=2248759 RepID=UPI000E238D4D|nr:DeoR/GlpR family DNA-binding transcription regulator [Tropicimonas sp. IMCC34011]